ncbi:MAG: arginine--tRNA ligase [Micrococcales bacterium]|nr:arginine--tRNA ligase [Micrococcales bacterium]
MTPEDLAEVLRALLRRAIADGALALAEHDIPATISLARAPRAPGREQGDWASNLALQLAKKAQTNPRALAQLLADGLTATPGVATVEVAGPGFINITLDTASAGELARAIVEAGPTYGHDDGLTGTHINVEFVSANPTGPLHLGGARWAAVGDALARILQARGAAITREYYFNDHGAQIDRFAASLDARARGQAPPKDGYGGQYIADIAQTVISQAAAEGRDLVKEPQDQAQEYFRSHGVALMFDEIKADLHAFGVDFDVYFHEDSLHESGAVAQAVEQLKDHGHLYEKDGAWWLRSTDHGDDKDRVVIKSDGAPAYIAGDIAYLRDKRERGADLAIYLLGADHHGYTARLKAAAAALGDNPDVVEVLIGQLVSLVKDRKPVKVSKRAGNIVTMQDLVEAVGKDAARYALVRASINSPLAIDLDLLASRTNDNPVFYVQYAHARTQQIAKNAAGAGVRREDAFDPALLDHATETALIAQLASMPRVVAQAATLREPHRVARYLEDVAAAYHTWYDNRRVAPFGDEAVTDAHRTRLWLNDATAQVLRNGLGLLGVAAPERM